MPVRPKLKIIFKLEPDAAYYKHIARWQQRELGIAQKILDDAAVFFLEDAASGINEPPARLHEPRGGGENRFLLFHELRNILGRLAPLHVGIAPQRPEAAAGCIHEHAVDLTGEALHARVVHALDPLRVHVGQSRARKPELEPGES